MYISAATNNYFYNQMILIFIEQSNNCMTPSILSNNKADNS